MTYRIQPENDEGYLYRKNVTHETMLKKIRKVAKRTKAKIIRATYDENGWLIVELQTS